MSVNELVQTYLETHTYYILHIELFFGFSTFDKLTPKTLVLLRKIEFEFLFRFRSLINQNNKKKMCQCLFLATNV